MLTDKKIWVSVLSGPLFFIGSGEFAYEVLRTRGFFVPLIAGVSTVALCLLTYLWQKKYVNKLLFGISSKLFDGTRRSSIALGVIFGVPLSIRVCQEYLISSYTSVIPYILMAPGIAIMGFVVIASLVCAAMWCVEGFISK